MMHLHLILCDTLIICEYRKSHAESDEQLWFGQCIDLHTGKRAQFCWTSEQLLAILVLSVGEMGENKSPGYDIAKLYNVAEEAIKGWPAQVRPIP